MDRPVPCLCFRILRPDPKSGPGQFPGRLIYRDALPFRPGFGIYPLSKQQRNRSVISHQFQDRSFSYGGCFPYSPSTSSLYAGYAAVESFHGRFFTVYRTKLHVSSGCFFVQGTDFKRPDIRFCFDMDGPFYIFRRCCKALPTDQEFAGSKYFGKAIVNRVDALTILRIDFVIC